MINTDNLLNGFKVLYEKLDERLDELTLTQLKELETALESTWGIISPRGKDRRRI